MERGKQRPWRKPNWVWRSFEDARAFVHTLQLKNMKEWHAYCRSKEKPADIPSDPQKVYTSKFITLGDWLGTGTVSARNRIYRSFIDARAYVHDLYLPNNEAWRTYCRSGNKPEDIPANPERVYKAEFQGYGDWLGTGTIAARNRQYLPFPEARAFVHKQGLKKEAEWRVYCRSREKPDTIPANPEVVYKGDFQSYGDWLGTGKPPHRRTYLPFLEARAFVRELKLKDQAAWKLYSKSEHRPLNIPSNPNVTYKAEFQGFGDWLGTGTLATKDYTYLPFLEARAFVRELKLKSYIEWLDYCKLEQKPSTIPWDPRQVYGEEFQGYGDWLGTGNESTHHRVYLPFEDARTHVRQLKLKGRDEWLVYCRSGKKPKNIPTKPERVYPTEFQGMGDWLGIINKWNKNALLALLFDLRPRLHQLEERELYTILQQGSMLSGFRVALGGASSLAVLKDLQENNGNDLERALRRASTQEIMIDQEVLEGAVEDTIAEEGNLVTLGGIGFEHDDHSVPFEVPSSVEALDQHLPLLATTESLHVVDLLGDLSCGLDEDAAEYLVTNRVSALWERYSSKGKEVVDELQADDGENWFREIKRRFLWEIEGVESLCIPEGWSFTDERGQPALPNAMQRRTAWAIREKRRVGNWSGVGSGKTLSAILASRVIDARVTLIVTNNAIVKGWKNQILRAYPDSLVLQEVGDRTVLDRDHHNYVVLNYEKFQTEGRNHLIHLLVGLRLDFLVFDEVQFVKQRNKDASNRRQALEALASEAARLTPMLAVLGMSATPVINNLLEAKKLLEIVTGLRFPELNTIATVNNALALHRALMVYGFRYRPSYEQEMSPILEKVTRNDLPIPLRAAQRTVLSTEQILLPAKLAAIHRYVRKGTIIYAHYVEEIVAPARRYIEQMGLTVGLYTGIDKSGLEPFLTGQLDVLIGTSPVGTGLDGLQKVSNRIIMLCLPWTSAEYEQIVGRIRRQGSNFERVEVVIPQVVLDDDEDTWSWDEGRLACIEYKRTLSDCVLNGTIPETVRMNQGELLKQSREALERWIERVDEDGLLMLERDQLTIPLPADLRNKIQRHYGDFTALNRRWNTSRSTTTHERLLQNPSEWYLYHTLYRETRQHWQEQPYQQIAERIQLRPEWVVGDFGCGECLLRQALPEHRVICIDYVAWDEQVIACDMTSTPLEATTLDVVVFSLSLMGKNWQACLKEAHRTLKPYGHLFIAEPQKRWQDDIEALERALIAEKFQIVGQREQRYTFIYITAVKL